MSKALAILCIITIAITGTAQATFSYIPEVVSVFRSGVNLVEGLIPYDQFHNYDTLDTSYHLDVGSTYPYPVAIEPLPVDDYSQRYAIFNSMMDICYENTDYLQEAELYTFPYPILEDIEGYKIDHVSWHPNIYTLTGNFGDIATQTNRSILTLVRFDIYYVRDGFFNSLYDNIKGAYIYSTYYFVIENRPRVYIDGVGVRYCNMIKSVNGINSFYVAEYREAYPSFTFETSYIRATTQTWSEYLERK